MLFLLQQQASGNNTGNIQFTRFLGHCLLWPWPLTFWPTWYVQGPGTYVT